MSYFSRNFNAYSSIGEVTVRLKAHAMHIATNITTSTGTSSTIHHDSVGLFAEFIEIDCVTIIIRK